MDSILKIHFVQCSRPRVKMYINDDWFFLQLRRRDKIIPSKMAFINRYISKSM